MIFIIKFYFYYFISILVNFSNEFKFWYYGRIVNQRNTYVMRITINNTKNTCYIIKNNFMWFKILSISKYNIQNAINVYNFEVEDDNSYCVENLIVHNCQPFSIAGKQKGFKDTRSNVFWKLIDIVDYYKPRIVVLENVKNLQSHDKGKTFKIIKKNLKKIKYHIKYKILNTCKITKLPHNRERLYIICFKYKKDYNNFNFDFDEVEPNDIEDYLEDDIDDKYYYDDRFKVWDTVKSGVKKKVYKNVVYQYRRYYIRENKSGVCPTLTANMGSGGHNVPLIKDDNGIRKLTPRECFNLQGFPKKYKLPNISDSKLYKLAGNCVSVPVVKLLANKIINILEL